ncbi:hypothetical protein [Dyella sp. OK004]|uniref:hypothetical protein n=1 Tax=Dyella sp. OK004 TaxID=1855292 RepID=UPI00116053D2|nr:hypothetical protein [Dyella sp. OK004]
MIRKTLAGCAIALTMASLPVWADGGLITFSGAIVEPTCSVGLQRIDAAEASAHPSQRYSCSERAGTTSGLAAQSYALSVGTTSETPLASDPLIVYFANYLNVQPKLVTQTYE